MFRPSSCRSSGATTTAVAASGLPSERGGSSAVGRDRAGCVHNRHDHDQQHCYHQAPTVNQRLLLQLFVAPDDGHEDAPKHVELYLDDRW